MTKCSLSSLARILACCAIIVLCLGLCTSVVAAGPVTQSAPGSTVAKGPKIWLQDNQPLTVNHVGPAAGGMIGGSAQALSMAAEDVDRDGVQDLLVGYSTPGGGVVVLHRGNLDAFAPQSEDSFQAIANSQFPSPFLAEAQVFAVPVTPDFLAVGDFTGHGLVDLAVAARGGSAIYILEGDGKGNFVAGDTINLPGGVTALAADRFGKIQSALLVGVSSGRQSFLAVYGLGEKGLAPLAALPLQAPASSILFGDFGDPGPDAAFLSGGQVQILRSTTMKTVTVSVPGTARAFALGSFIWDRNAGPQIAILGADGSVQIAARNEFDPRIYTPTEFNAIRQASVNRKPAPDFVPPHSFPVNGWRIVESFPGLGTIGPSQVPVFFRTRISVNGADDIAWLNAASGQMVLISHPDVQLGDATFKGGQVSVKPYNGTPVAGSAMRLNVDGRLGVVALHQGEVAPALSVPIPDPNFFVNTDNDPTPTSPIANACSCTTGPSCFTSGSSCSLREAILKANGDTIMLQAGHTYSLTRGRVTATPDYTGDHGALYVNNTATIVGGNQNTTIIQWGTLTSGNTVDMVMAVNEDISPQTNATGSLSNLTIQGGVNHGTQSGFDGDGGCMEFDTGTAGTATLSLTNVTLQNCSTLQGGGGGLVIFSALHPAGGGGATISNSIFQNNSVVSLGAAGNGGGIAIAQDAHMTMTASKILNNNATQDCNAACLGAPGNAFGAGGAIVAFAPQNVSATTAENFIHSSTISGNQAAGFGGGIDTSASFSIDSGTVISGNKAGVETTPSSTTVANQEGGGLLLNPAASCPLASTCTVTLSKVTITGNSATGNGGGISYGNASAGTTGALTMSFSRLAGNTTSGGSGSNLSNNHATATVTNNWWGTNAASSTINTIGGTTTFDPFIVLTHTASADKIKINASSTLTGDMSKDSHGNGAALSGNLDEIVGLPITFDKGTPNLGSIPQAQPETLGNPVPTATATYNAGGVGGLAHPTANVDQATVDVDSNLIATATESGTTATITTVGAHNFIAGNQVTIAGVTGAGTCSGYNGTFIIASVIGSPTTQFTYAAPGGLSTCGGGSADIGLVILQPPSITKTFGGTKVVKTNTPNTITFAITNGNVVTIDAGFTDNLPQNVGTVPGNLVVATPPNVNNPCGGTVTATAGSSTISFDNPNFAVGTCSIKVDVQSAVDNPYSNSVTVTSTDAGNGNTANDTLTVINPPSISKSFNPTSIPLNGTSSLTFTITNSNVNTTLNGVAFTDTLPTGLTVVTNTSTVCGGTLTTTNPTGISLSGATIAPGAQCQFPVTVTGATAGQYTNTTGNVSSTNGGTGNTATANLIVVAPPTITKHFGHTTVPLNQSDTLSFTVTNPNTTSALSGVAFTDALPGGLKLASTTVTGSCGSGTITATINNPPGSPSTVSLSGGTLAASPAAGSSCTFSVSITGISAGAQVNTTGTVSSTEGGTGGTATDTITVVAPPTTTKLFNPTTISVGGTSTMTITITNPSATVGLTGVGFTDTFPANLVVATPNGLSNTCNGTPSAVAGSGTVSLTGGTIAANSSCAVTVNVTSSVSGNYLNSTGPISSTEGGNGAAATATLTVAAPPTIAKSFSPKSIPLNGTSTLSFTLTNPNNNVGLSGVSFTDSLPGGAKLASTLVTGSCGSGTITATINNPPGSPSTVSLSGGTLASSGSCTFSVSVTGISAGAQVNTTSAVSSTEGGTGGTASDTLTVVGPPTISKHFGHTTVALNQSDTLSFTVTNPNTASALSGIAFTDSLPGGLKLASTTVTGSCGSGTITATINNPPGTPSTVSLSGGTLTASPAAGSSCTFSVSITGISSGAQVNTTSTVSSTEGGTGGTATDTITVVPPPTIAKAFNPTTISVGGTSTLTITITNPAGNTVQENGVAFTDSFPANLVVATPNGLTNTCSGTATATAGSGTVSLVGGTIAANSSCTVTVTVTSSVSGNYLNSTGPVSSTNGGIGTAATATLTVASPPSIAKAFSPKTIPLNGSSTLTFTIQNPNSGVAFTGVAFSDTLPLGLVVATPNGLSNTCNGAATATAGSNSISLTGGTIATSGSCTVVVNVTGTAAGSFTNTSGAVSSNEGGPGNTATDTLTVNQASTSTAVASSANPSVFGVPVTFTATVTNTSAGSTGQPTGTVQFVVDGVNFGPTVPLAGASSNTSTATSQAVATLSVTGSPHTVSANYLPADTNFVSSTGSLAGGQTVTIASTTTAVVSSANPSVFGQSVTFTATLTDVSPGSTAQPTGTVQFVVDGVNFGPAVVPTGATSNSSTATSQATATLTIAGSPHSVSAQYVNTDGNFSGGSASLNQTVNQAGATITVNASLGTITLGDTETFTATVTANPPASGTPTGIVIFFDGPTPIGGGKLSGGQTTFSTAVLAVGSHSITAIYNGDADFTASPLSAAITETVNLRGSATSVGLNPTTVAAGQASTATVTVTDGGASTPPGTADTFAKTGAPATGRIGFTATLIADGAVVVIGGTDANGAVLNSAEVYSGGAFTPVPGNLNTARTGAVAALLGNGKVLVAGGSSDGSANGALNSAELLDLNSGTFAPTSHNMTAARFGMTATLLDNGKVLIAGGQNSGGVVNSAELYDPASDTFTATGNLNTARTGASATRLVSGHVLVAGGSSTGTANGALNSAEVFDADGNGGAGAFISVAGANPTLSTGRWQPEAALLLSGKVLIAGGQNSIGPGPVTTADIYDPAADSFTASTHQMNEARADGSAVALPSGMVLLAGGTTSQTVDLYDAEGDKFNLTGSLLHHDDGLVSTLLNNGQVLVVGLNTDNPAPFVSDAELYSPSFNPLGTVGFGSSDGTDVFGAACVLAPSTATASTCTSTVTPVEVGTSPHTITATYPADVVHSGSSNTASLTVIPTAPPTIAKAFSAINVAQNSTVSVTFIISNTNAAATLTGISFTDSLPAGLVVATPNNLNSNCGGTFTAVAGSSSLSLTGGSLAPPGPPPIREHGKTVSGVRPTVIPAASGQCVISLDLLVTGTGTISNTTGPISANESGPGNPSNTATINVVVAPTMNKVFGAASIPTGGITSLTFNIANPNTAIGLVGIALNDTLPSGLVVASPNGATGTCLIVGGSVTTAGTLTAVSASGSISLANLALNPSGSCTVAVNVTGKSGGTQNNTTAPITGTFDDGSGTFRVVTGGTASASIVVVAPPSISKAFVPVAIAPGGVSTLTFTITNPPVNTAALAGVAFTDVLPANVVVATPNGLTGNCNGGTATAIAGSGSISLTGGTIPAAGSCAISVNVTGSVVGSFVNITGAVSSTNGGTGNIATATLFVGHANLSITKTHVGNFPRNSTNNNYTITVSNDPTQAPTVGTVTVTDTLPNVNNTLVPTAMTGTGWTCTLGTLTCTRSDTLAPGASYPAITLTVTVPQNIQANVVNSATVSGGNDLNSHTANDPTHIGAPLQLSPEGSNNAEVIAGGVTSVIIDVESTAGEGALTMSCSGLPKGVTCSFNPPTTNALSTPVTVVFTTTLGTASARPPASGPVGLYAMLFPVFGVLLLGAGAKRDRKRLRQLFVVLGIGLLLSLLVLSGCGGLGMRNGGTPASVSSTVTVTATSATGDTGSTTINLTVLNPAPTSH